MLPSVDARKKTIDQSIYVKGTLTSKQHDVPRETITFSIMSDKTSSAQLAALPIVLKGPWVNAHLAGDALSENHSIVLAFKEGKIGLDCSTQSLSGSKPTRFPVYLLFDRGVELWTSEEPLQIAAGVTGSESTWRHLKLFAQAQHANTKSARRSDSNGPAKESIEEAQQNWNASKDTDSLAETSPFQIPAAQSNARREETAEADSQISPPPTGITQIEAGSSPPARSTDEDAPQAAMKNTKVRAELRYFGALSDAYQYRDWSSKLFAGLGNVVHLTGM